MNGDLRCIRKRSYPDALLAEIGDSHSDSSELSDHRRWCGDWIDATHITLGEELWAFFDEVEVSDDVEDVILAKGSGRLAVSDVSKFRAACRSMVASNAAGPAGQVAFEHLDGLLSGAVTSSTLGSALAGVGLLAGHVCDTPATVGLDYGNGNGHSLHASVRAQRLVLPRSKRPCTLLALTVLFAPPLQPTPVPWPAFPLPMQQQCSRMPPRQSSSVRMRARGFKMRPVRNNSLR